MRRTDFLQDDSNAKISFLNNSKASINPILDKFNKFKPQIAKLDIDVNKENAQSSRPISY